MKYAIIIATLLLSGCSTSMLSTCANKCRFGGLDKYQDETTVCVCKNLIEF